MKLLSGTRVGVGGSGVIVGVMTAVGEAVGNGVMDIGGLSLPGSSKKPL